MDYIKLTKEVLSVEEATSLVTHPSCGAISLFIGTTRDNFEVIVLYFLSGNTHQTIVDDVVSLLIDNW